VRYKLEFLGGERAVVANQGFAILSRELARQPWEHVHGDHEQQDKLRNGEEEFDFSLHLHILTCGASQPRAHAS
jgi:hypothetical protein